jgi:hypothetical protein
MVAVGGSARDNGPIDSGETGATGGSNEPAETLEDADGLGWASLGSWTDIAIKSSRQDILRQTIDALQKAVEAEDAEQRRAQKNKKNRLVVVLAALPVLLVLTVTLLTVSLAGNTKALSWAVLAATVATLGFSSGSAFAATRTARRSKRDIRLYQATLQHEAEYRRRIAAQDECA